MCAEGTIARFMCTHVGSSQAKVKGRLQPDPVLGSVLAMLALSLLSTSFPSGVLCNFCQMFLHCAVVCVYLDTFGLTHDCLPPVNLQYIQVAGRLEPKPPSHFMLFIDHGISFPPSFCLFPALAWL